MAYLISFLEGIITFVSPCLLPMIPLYISYFAGQELDRNNTIKCTIGFVTGFTIVFVVLGAFAGTIGRALNEYINIVNIIMGAVIILFGLNFMEIIKIPFFNIGIQLNFKSPINGFFSSVLFGIVFSVGWTPCVGTFLGSALMLAATQGKGLKGVLMLFCYSIGLGIPFILSAFLMHKLKSSFDFIKRNYKIINIISGIFLIIMGVLMATGMMGYFLSLLTF